MMQMKDNIGQINVIITEMCHGNNAPITNIMVPPQVNVTVKMLEVRGRTKGWLISLVYVGATTWMEEHAWPHKYLPTNIIAKLCGNAIQSKPFVKFGK